MYGITCAVYCARCSVYIARSAVCGVGVELELVYLALLWCEFSQMMWMMRTLRGCERFLQCWCQRSWPRCSICCSCERVLVMIMMMASAMVCACKRTNRQMFGICKGSLMYVHAQAKNCQDIALPTPLSLSTAMDKRWAHEHTKIPWILQQSYQMTHRSTFPSMQCVSAHRNHLKDCIEF